MSLKIAEGVVVLGNDTVNPQNNITIKTPAVADGSLEIYQGVPGALGSKLMGLDANGTPAFKLVKVNTQSLVSGAAAKVTFDTIALDTHGWISGNRFTPQRAGWYSLTLVARVFTNSFGSSGGVFLYKNGVITDRSVMFTNGNSASEYAAFSLTALEYFNGSTDYAELWASSSATNPFLGANTYFAGFLVRES